MAAGPPVQAERPMAAGLPLASWGRRLAAYLLDELVALGPFMVVLLVGGIITLASGNQDGPSGALALGIAIAFGVTWLLIWPVWIWNFWVRQGRTGRSLAKGWLGLRVVSADDGQPIGVQRAIGRDLCHTFIDAWAYLGFLWPLWDARRQTFADMIVRTVVVSER